MTSYAIALGHNAATPTALHALTPPLFARYEDNSRVEMTFDQSTLIGGDDARVAVARPRITWRLALTEAEWDHLRTTFFAASESPALTIRSRDARAAGKPFVRWNVTGYWNDLERETRALALPGAFWRVELAFAGAMSLGA
ncbi:MAG: hypothetical protein SGI73_08050 [Chloroflexota bacterium]|nr:hypothetical protein [Chloroflexota bacterium]